MAVEGDSEVTPRTSTATEASGGVTPGIYLMMEIGFSVLPERATLSRPTATHCAKDTNSSTTTARRRSLVYLADLLQGVLAFW